MYFVAPVEIFALVGGIIGSVFLLIYFLLFKPFLKSERILKYGEPATALVMEVAATGMEVNKNPVVKLTLEVTPKRGSKFTTTVKTMVSMLNPMAFVPGMIVDVKVDPDDNQSVAVVPNPKRIFNSQPQQVTTEDPEIQVLLEEAIQDVLQRMKDLQDDLPYNGKKGTGVILSSWLLNVNVNGENPLMEFMLQVQPENGSAFFAEVKGVVKNESTWKYTPGKKFELWYDPEDTSRIYLVGEAKP
jgi:hypothetical protein